MEFKENGWKILLALAFVIFVGIARFNWLKSLGKSILDKIPAVLICAGALLILYLLALYFFQDKLIYISFSSFFA